MKAFFVSVLLAPFFILSSFALEVGDDAPVFEGKLDSGETWKSADAGDKTVVVYFYPAAMTGGCTKQACGFRDSKEAFEKHNALVIGVSGDKPAGLALFKQDSKLNFPLMADPDGSIAKAFGVPTRKGGSLKRSVAGVEHTLERGVSAARWTFIIKDGKILHKNDKVKAAEDSKAVLAILANNKK